MSWFLIALLPPALYALTNHTDKYLLSKYFKSGEVGGLILFSALFSIFAVPIVYLISPAVLVIGWASALLLALSGMLIVGSIIFYLYALKRDEASLVVPLYQLIPIFGFLLGYFFLGEALIRDQIIGSVLIILGVLLLSLRLGQKRNRFRAQMIWLMAGSSFLYAVNGVIFKYFALDTGLGFWTPVFWMLVGKVALGAVIFFALPSFRRQFLAVLRSNSAFVIGLNSANETISIVADSIIYFATLFAPIALVYTVSGTQPLFVFIYGILLTLFWPKLGRESLGVKSVTQKLAAIILIVAGSFFLN